MLKIAYRWSKKGLDNVNMIKNNCFLIFFTGNPPPGTVGGGGSPNGAANSVLALVPAGLNAVAVFPPFATPRTVEAEAVIFAEDPSIG